MFKKLCLIIISTLFIGTSSLCAKEIKIAVGLALPPYFIAENNSGMEYEIVKEALAFKGHTLKATFVPFARVIVELENKTVDAAATVNSSSGLKNVFYSESHITYQNVAISLKKKNYNIASIGDLGKYSIVSFQNATSYLGEDFAKMAKGNSKYTEIANQESQTKMLFAERADLLVGDVNIFKFYKEKITDVDNKQEVVIHQIFTPVNYSCAFTDEAIKKDFDEGLKKLKSSGRYNEIIKKYIK